MHNNTLNHAIVTPGTIPSAVRGECPGSWSVVTARMPFGTLYGVFEPRLRDLMIEPLVGKPAQAIDSDSNLTAEETNRTDRPGSYRCRKRKLKLPH